MKPIAVIALVAIVFLASRAAHAWPTVRHVDTKSYDVDPDVNFVVEDSSGQVSVTGWASDRVEIVATKTAGSQADLDQLDTGVDAHGDHLSVIAKYPDRCSNCDISLRIRVPARAHVTIDSASGDIGVASIDGPVRAQTASGDVSIQQVNGEVHAHTSSGDIELKRITSAIDASTASGDIAATDIASDAKLVAMSGSVSAQYALLDNVSNIHLESTSGDVSLVVPRGAGFKVAAETRSGSIDSNLDLPIDERAAGAYVSAQVGTGKANVRLIALSGDIDITMH